MRSGPVPIQTAADTAGVDVGQIRRWADIGSVEIQRRGGVETVLLESVMALAASVRHRRRSGDRDALRARLADAKASFADVDVSLAGELAADRAKEASESDG